MYDGYIIVYMHTIYIYTYIYTYIHNTYIPMLREKKRDSLSLSLYIYIYIYRYLENTMGTEVGTSPCVQVYNE